MLKQLIPAIAFIILLGSCSSLKPLNFTSSKQVSSGTTDAPAQKSSQKFLEEITVTPQATDAATIVIKNKEETVTTHAPSIQETAVKNVPKTTTDIITGRRPVEVENVSAVQ